MQWVPEWLQSMVSKKEKKKLIQSKLRYPMVWERSNKRDWDLHLKAGLFRSLYLCTHCHYFPDVLNNRLPLPSWCFDQSVYMPHYIHQLKLTSYASLCSHYSTLLLLASHTPQLCLLLPTGLWPIHLSFCVYPIWKTKTIMGLICRVKYFSINGFMTCKIIFVIFFLLKKCLNTILLAI